MPQRTEDASFARRRLPMLRLATCVLPWLLTVSTALGQRTEEPDPPAYEGNPFERIERENKLVDLQWRRNGSGNLEYAIAGAKDAKFKRVFGRRLDEVMSLGSLAGFVAPLLHHGDLLSLTDGEAHLRRLGIATDTAALAAFARSDMGKAAASLAELDRLVAVDLLAARADGPAREALAGLANDASAPAAVRARAGVAPRREHLGTGDLALPQRADAFVTINHARLVDAHVLLELGRLTCLVSSAMVMKMLKRPLLDDAAIGEAEGDATLALPFELVRRLGAIRLDHSCTALRWPHEIGSDVAWASTVVGSFQPARIAHGVRSLPVTGLEVALAENRATATWAGGSAAVDARLATGKTTGVDTAADEALAKQVLRDGSYGVRVLIPAGSKLLAAFTLGGFANTTTYELEVTWGDPILIAEKFTMKDDATAAAKADKVVPLIERFSEQLGQSDLFAKIGPPDVSVASNVINCTRRMPQSQLPRLAELRAKLLANAQTRRVGR